MKINAVCLVACLLASVAPTAAAEQHLVDSPVLMKILKTVDEAPTDEHLLDVTLRLLKGICECMTETLLVKPERTSHPDASAIPYTTWMDDGAARNTTWKELELYQKIYNNTCFNLRNELAVKVDVDELERTKNENDTQSSFKTWNCGKQHEITTERIVMASTSMSPVLDDSLRSQLDNILFKTLILTKDYHTYTLRRRNLFGKTIPVTRNKKNSIIVIVTLHPPQMVSRNGKEPRKNFGPLSEINEDKLDEIELNRTIYSKSAVDIDIFDTDFNPTKKESNENDKSVVSKCVLLSIYKFLTESEINNHTKVFKVLRRKKTIKIYVEIMTSQGDSNYSGMCCDSDAITTACTQQYIAKHLGNDEAQDNIPKKLKQNSIPKFEERSSDYKDTIAKIKILLKLYDNELTKSTFNGKRVVVDNKLEGPKHGSHVGGDARAIVIDVFAKHESVADHVTKSTNSDKVEFTTQIFSTTAPTIPTTYTFKGFYDDDLWNNTIISQKTKTTSFLFNFSNDNIINEFRDPVPTKSNINFLNIKMDHLKKEYIRNSIKREHASPKVRTTRSTAIKEIQTDLAFDTKVNTEWRSTDQIQQTLNPYVVIPLNYGLVLNKNKNKIKTTDEKASTEYSINDNSLKITYFQDGINLSRTTKKQYPENISNFKIDTENTNKNAVVSNNNLNHKIISKVHNFETETENVSMDSEELKTTSDLFESFTEDNTRSTQTRTMNVQQKTANRDSNYSLRATDTAGIKQNDFNQRKSKTTKSANYENSTKLNYNDTIYNSQKDMDFNEKYKHAIMNSNLESIHRQQFTDYNNIIDPTTDKITTKDSLLVKNSETLSLPPEIDIISSSIATMEPSAEYVEYSSESGEKHENMSTYDGNKHASANLFESLIPLEPIVTSNNFSENEHFTTYYKSLVENTTESLANFNNHLQNIDLPEKYDNLKNLTGYSLPIHNIKQNKSQARDKVSYNAQVIKSSAIENMNPIPIIVDNNLSMTENVIALSIISEDVTPNPNLFIKDTFEYTATPVIIVTDKYNVFEINTDKMLQSYEFGGKQNLDHSENSYLKNGADGIVLESNNKIPVHVREKDYVETMNSATSTIEYINVEQLESITEPNQISKDNSYGIIEGKSTTISSSRETDETTINSGVINGEYSMITSEHEGTVTSNGRIKMEEINDGITITAEKPETKTENIGNSAEHSATANKETPETIREANQMDYSEQIPDGKINYDFVYAPESHKFAPMSLKKVKPLLVDRESSQIFELVSTTKKNTASIKDFDQVVETSTFPYFTKFPMNVLPILKNISGKPNNNLASTSEEAMVNNKNNVHDSESHTLTSTLPMNVKPLVYTQGKKISKLKLTTTTVSTAPINSKQMTDEEKRSYINRKIKNTTEDTGEIQMNVPGADVSLVHNESDQISESYKFTPTSTRIDLLVTDSDGKEMDNSASANKQSKAEQEESTAMKTMLQDRESKTPKETQDIKVIASSINATTYTTPITGYVDYSAESGEKYTNKSFQIHSANGNQKYLTVKVLESLSPVESITMSNYLTTNQNFTANHENLKVNKTDYSVQLSSHPENVDLSDENKINIDNITEASFYIPKTKNNKSQDLSDNLQAIISSGINNFTTNQSKASYQGSEFSQHVEPLEIPREGKPITSTENKLMVTDKGFLQDPQIYTVAPTLNDQQTNEEYLGIGKEGQKINEGMLPTSVFQFFTLTPTIPTNVVPLFTTTTDNPVNGSISATRVNVILNNKDLVQTLESRTAYNDTIHKIEMDSALEQIQAKSNKDSIESVIEKLADTDTRPILKYETSTITTEKKQFYSTLIYTNAAFLHTTISNSIESKATSMLTNTQSALSLNDVITKKYAAADEQVDGVNLITSTIESDKVMDYYDAKQNNFSLKSLESEMEEKLFNVIEKEESGEKIKGNLNITPFDQQPETTLRNSIDELYPTTKPNLRTNTDTLSSVRTILSNRAEIVSLDSQKDNSVETLTISTQPSLSDRMSSMKNTVIKVDLKNSQSKIKNDEIGNEYFTLDYSEITSIHAPENIRINESDKTANHIAAPNLKFQAGSQQISYHEHIDNITNLMPKKGKPISTSKYNESTDVNDVIIPKTKKRPELKAINITDERLANLISLNDSAINSNIQRPTQGSDSKKQEKENDGSIIGQEGEKIGDREPFIQNVTENNQILHQTPQKFLFFIKNSQNKAGTNFYLEGYNKTSLMQNATTENMASKLHLTSLMPSDQENYEVNEITTSKNYQAKSTNGLIDQVSRTNAELESKKNKSGYSKFKDQERDSMNVLNTLTSREITAGANSKVNEFTTLINEKELATIKDDLEQDSDTKLELQSKENKLEYTGVKYQDGKTPNDESIVISKENSSATKVNKLLKLDISIYPTTVNSDINEVTNLVQEGDQSAAKNVMELFIGTKKKLESKENYSKNIELKGHGDETEYVISTLIPVITTRDISAMVENLIEIDTSNFSQFIPEYSKGNEITTLRNNQTTIVNNIKQGNKIKLDNGSKENKSEYTKLNRQTDEIPQTLVTLTSEEIKAEVNPKVNKITTLSQKNKQDAVKYDFDQNSETQPDLEGKRNKFEFTDLKYHDDKPYISTTITLEDIEATSKNYIKQNRGTNVELGARQNKSEYEELKNLKSETLEEGRNSSLKKTTAAISSNITNNLSIIETTTNVAIGTDIPNNDKFAFPLAVTADILSTLSGSTIEEIKSGKNYEANEFITLSNKNEAAKFKDYIENDNVNKADLKAQENKSDYTQLKVMESTTWRNEHEEAMHENHMKEYSTTKRELEDKENKSEYTKLIYQLQENQESEKANEIFTSISTKNTVGMSDEVVKNLPKTETSTIVIPKRTYLFNNYKFTPPIAATEDNLYDLYTSTSDEIKKELHSEVNKIITLRNENITLRNENNPKSPKDIIKNDSEINVKLQTKENKSTKYTTFINTEDENKNQTSISVAKEITTGMLANTVNVLPKIETGINITDVPYNDKFTLSLAVTEDIINALSALNQDDIKLEVSSEVNVLKDHIAQNKTALKMYENEILKSIPMFTPEEIKAEVKLEGNKITTVINENQQPNQQDQIEQYSGNSNLETKENKFKNTEFQKGQEERSSAISTSIAKDITNALATVVDDLYNTETLTDVLLSTGIYNLDQFNYSDLTPPLLEIEDTTTSKIMEEATHIKMTSDAEYVNQGNVLHNPYVGNNKEINDINISSKTKYIISSDFTSFGKNKPTTSIDVGETKQNIGSLTLDYNKENQETFKNVTEYEIQPIYRVNVSNIEVKSHFLSDKNAPISLDTLKSKDNNIVTPAEEEIMTTTSLYEMLPNLIEGKDNVNIQTATIIFMNESLSNDIESVNTMNNETSVDKLSVDKLSTSTKSLLPEEDNTESSINRKINILNTESTTIEIQSLMKETVPQIISKEVGFTFNNFVTDAPMVDPGTVPVTINIPSSDLDISALPEDEKESFIITLPKPLLEKIKKTNHTIYVDPRTYDDEEKPNLSGEDKHIITNGFLKIGSSNIDFDNIMKKYKVSISALKQKIVNENGTNATTIINQAEQNVVFTNSLERPQQSLLQNIDTDDIETHIAIKKPKITTVEMKYPTLIYSPVSYLDQRLNTGNNNLASNHDSLLSDTNDSLQKKYSEEADEVLSELAAVLNTNCSNKNKVSPSEICYTNVLASIAQGSDNLPTDDPAVAKLRYKNVSKNATLITSETEKKSSAAQKTSSDAEQKMSKSFTNLTHSDSDITEVKMTKLTTYANETNPSEHKSQYDTRQTERDEPLHLTVPNKISSLNSEYIKEDDDFRKAILIASAFKNLDFLFKKSGEDTSQKETKSLNAEFSPLKVQLPTTALADKASKVFYNVAVAAKNKYNSLHSNDSKIYYIPFISNAAFNKQTLETSLNMTDHIANPMKQELALANLNIYNETNNTMNTPKILDPKDNKIQSMSSALNSNIKPQNNIINDNLHDPTGSKQVSSIDKYKAFDDSYKKVNIKTVDNDMISKTKTSKEVTSNGKKEHNKITESLTTLDNTFNNSVLSGTDANILSPAWISGRMENVDDEDFQDKRDLVFNMNKNSDLLNQNMFHTTHSNAIKKNIKWASFNATESLIKDNVDLISNKFTNKDDTSTSNGEVSTTLTKSISDSPENNTPESKVINLRTSIFMNKITRDLTKDEEFDHFRSKDNIQEDGVPSNIINKYVTPVVFYKSSQQSFAETILSNELFGAETSQEPKSEIKQFSIAPDKVSIGFNFPVSTEAAHEITKKLINTETGEPYLIQMNIKDPWNSLEDMINTNADNDVNTIQAYRSVSNRDPVNNVFYSGKSALRAIETDVNYTSTVSSNDKIKLSRQSYKQTMNDFDKQKTLKRLFTEEIIQNLTKKQVTIGYVPIMTFTEPPKALLITKPVPSIIQMSKTYKPSSRIGFNSYTTKINSQTVGIEPEKRNNKSSPSHYILNLKNNKNSKYKYITKSTSSEANIDKYVVSKLTHLAPETVEKITNYDNVPSKAPGKKNNVLKLRLNSNNINNDKSDHYNTLTNAYSIKKKDKEIVKNSTPKKQSSLVGNKKYDYSSVADDALRFFLQSTHSYYNIRPKAATERNTVENILYSILSNKTVTRSTKKIKRHRNTKYAETDLSTTTTPRRTTVRKKRRRTSKRIVYNTYEPTMYEDLEIDFTDELGKKVSQVKPTRANGEEILSELLKSSDHVHIGDATAVLPWPVYFPTPITTRQVNVRGKIELSHIVRQKNHQNTESIFNKSMKSIGKIDIKMKPRPTRLPIFNTFYRDATEKMTILPENYVDSGTMFFSIIDSKPTRLVNFNHYSTVLTTEPTRLSENEIRNSIDTTPLQSKQFIYSNGPVGNAFTSTLLPPETINSRKHSGTRKTEKKLKFYEGFGKMYEKSTHFPKFGDVYKRTADTTKNVNVPVINENLIMAAKNENNVAEDKATAFMKATRSSNMKILLFHRTDPRVRKINQFQTKKVKEDITYSTTVKRSPVERFADKEYQIVKKSKSKMSTGGNKSLRTNFVPSQLVVASTTETSVNFTLKDFITSNVQKSSDIIKNLINKSQRVKEILLDPLDPVVKTKLYPIKVIPKYKVKKVHFSVDENNLLTAIPKELMLNNMNGMATARRKFFDDLTRKNMKTYIVHSAKPSLSRQILLRPKFVNIDNAVRITQVPSFERTKKDTRPKLIGIDLFENRMPVAFNLVANNKKPIRGLAPNKWHNKLNTLEKPLYFPKINRKARVNSETKYGMSTRGFLVPEEKYFLESPLESFKEAAIVMPSTPSSRYHMTPLRPRRSRRTIFFLSPTASYIQYF